MCLTFQSFCQFSLKVTVGTGRDEWYTLLKRTSCVFVDIISFKTEWWESVVENNCVWPCLDKKRQSLSLSKPDIDSIHCVLVCLPLLLASSKSGLSQVEFFLLVTMHCNKIHDCKEYRLSLSAGMLLPAINPEAITDCMLMKYPTWSWKRLINWMFSWMTLDSSKVKNFSVSRIDTILELFSFLLRLFPSTLSMIELANIQNSEIMTRIVSSVIWTQSLHHHLEEKFRVSCCRITSGMLFCRLNIKPFPRMNKYTHWNRRWGKSWYVSWSRLCTRPICTHPTILHPIRVSCNRFAVAAQVSSLFS